MCTDLAGPDPEQWYPITLPLHSRTPMLDADELIYLKGMNDRLRDTALPYRTLKARRSDLLRKRTFPAYAIASNLLLSVYSNPISKRDDAIAAVNGGRILMALLAHKDRFGGYPRSLGELRSSLGWKLPEDPFSGKDLVYRRQGKGFILYSIGVNLKDDGGRSYDRPPEKSSPVETPPPGYDTTAKPAPTGGAQSTSGATGVVPVETPPPGWSDGAAGPPTATPPQPPPKVRKPKPPYSTRQMPYETVDGRHSEDIIWQLDR